LERVVQLEQLLALTEATLFLAVLHQLAGVAVVPVGLPKMLIQEVLAAVLVMVLEPERLGLELLEKVLLAVLVLMGLI
jgi:hypothetical protein